MQYINRVTNIAPVVIVAALAVALVAGYFPGAFEDLPIAGIRVKF